MPWRIGIAPPESPVPAPRGTTGTSSRAADLQDALDLRLGFGQRHRERQAAVGGEAVAFVRRGVFVAKQQAMRGQHGHQRLHDFALALFQHFGRKLRSVHLSSPHGFLRSASGWL